MNDAEATWRWPGVNQRQVVRMDADEASVFLRENHRAVLSTLNPDGAIHSVPMHYGVVDDAVVFLTKRASQKVRNLRRNGRATCLIEVGDVYDDFRGVQLIGWADVTHDQTDIWRIGVSLYERVTGPYGPDAEDTLASMLRKRVGIRMHPERIVSWDHRKLPVARTSA